MPKMHSVFADINIILIHIRCHIWIQTALGLSHSVMSDSFWPMDCSLPGSTVQILEWVAKPSSRASSGPRDRTQVSRIARQILYQLSHQGSLWILEWVAYPFSRDLPDPGIELGSSALQVDSLPAELSGKPLNPEYVWSNKKPKLANLFQENDKTLTLHIFAKNNQKQARSEA